MPRGAVSVRQVTSNRQPRPHGPGPVAKAISLTIPEGSSTRSGSTLRPGADKSVPGKCAITRRQCRSGGGERYTSVWV
jgi:hypothetical protein